MFSSFCIDSHPCDSKKDRRILQDTAFVEAWTDWWWSKYFNRASANAREAQGHLPHGEESVFPLT